MELLHSAIIRFQFMHGIIVWNCAQILLFVSVVILLDAVYRLTS